MFCKGQTSTGLYRFLAQHGGYVWIETDAAVINNNVTDKPEHIVCVHSVVRYVCCDELECSSSTVYLMCNFRVEFSVKVYVTSRRVHFSRGY